MARTVTDHNRRHLDVFVPMPVFDRLERVRKATPNPESRSAYLRLAILRQIIEDERRIGRRRPALVVAKKRAVVSDAGRLEK